MNDDANGFAQAAFGFGAGCHAHGFLGFLLFIGRRARRQKTVPTRPAVRFASRKWTNGVDLTFAPRLVASS
jgi:hypothetical protein